jgi:hypothetical protein
MATENFLDRLQKALNARQRAKKAQDYYMWRYDGCDEQRDYSRAVSALMDSMKDLMGGDDE